MRQLRHQWPDVLDTALGHDDRFSQSTPIPAAMERTRGLHETHGFGASSGDLANVTAEQVGATDMQSVDLSSFPLEPAPNRLSDAQSLSFSFGDVDTFLPHLQVDEDTPHGNGSDEEVSTDVVAEKLSNLTLKTTQKGISIFWALNVCSPEGTQCRIHLRGRACVS